MKYSVFTVVMGEFSLEQTAQELKHLGYDGVEWRVHADYHISPEDVQVRAEEINLLAKSHDLEIPVLGTYLDPANLEGVRKALLAAQIMDCPAVRVRSASYTGKASYGEVLQEAISSLGEVEQFSRETNVKILLEIHSGTIIPSASAARRLVSGFDPKCIGLIYDPANMILEGRENWKMGLEILGEYLAHVHVKNVAWFQGKGEIASAWEWRYAPLDEGMVDWQEVLVALKSAGYDGYLSIEDLYGSGARTTGLIQENLAAQDMNKISTPEKLKRDLNYLKDLNEHSVESEIREPWEIHRHAMSKNSHHGNVGLKGKQGRIADQNERRRQTR